MDSTTATSAAPGEVVDVAARFTDHRGRDVVPCHDLAHEDMAMMATFRTE